MIPSAAGPFCGVIERRTKEIVNIANPKIVFNKSGFINIGFLESIHSNAKAHYADNQY
jgi:hypothetical protein